jgi:hypothetical protein
MFLIFCEHAIVYFDVTITKSNALYFRTVLAIESDFRLICGINYIHSFCLAGNYFTVHHHYLKVTEISVQKPEEDSRSACPCCA